MAISREIQTALDRGDFDAIETQWLAHSGEAPDDLDYFVGIARALVGTGESDRARFLLELLYDLLGQKELWQIRLKLLQRAGHILFETPEEGHEAILATLGELYKSHSNYKELLDKLGLNRAPQDVPKTWEKVGRFQNLMSFDIGTVVRMKGKGAGRIIDVNLPLQSLKIDFEKFPALMVGFRAASKMLIPLESDHYLVRKLETPDEMKALALKSPAQLLGMLLQSFGEPMTGAEIKTHLSGIVPDKKWASWWSTARKHPQVITRGKGRQTYQWADTTADAFEALWLAFTAAAPRAKLDLYRRDAKRDEGLAQRMVESLRELGSRSTQSDPSLAVETWYELERGGTAPKNVSWEPRNLLAEHENPFEVLRAIQDRGRRELAYAQFQEISSNWPNVYEQLLRHEQESALLSSLADAVISVQPEAFQRYTEQLISQPRKQPAAFVWLAERAADDPDLLGKSPLRLLSQLLSSLQDDRFAPYRASRMVPLFESGGTVPRLLPFIEMEQAEQAKTVISRAAGLEEYQRQALVSSLELKFASLRQDAEAPLYALPASIDTKREELRELRLVEIPANRTAIEEARAMGDLRENFEYKSARQRHEYLNSRLAALSHDLSRAQPIDLSHDDISTVHVGTRVELSAEDSPNRVLSILGPWESSPEDDIISYESELAKGLLGKKPGESCSTSGVQYTIVQILAYQ